jgi:hypothetical protein
MVPVMLLFASSACHRSRLADSDHTETGAAADVARNDAREHACSASGQVKSLDPSPQSVEGQVE